ncbi:MAG: hypothetical protein A2289_26955 [Deltaproteobacteria bacterium RIFOXYA12_FULL_58_15]|nr:MAG: hypothetical protein A2289_26955 [Deltaproteobacteria bacterium RIFOXYA12_FULL_58_15]OGR13608.1 MAG: hypothetical protein A2341_22640 [Deltaproteobacteria bacterium RIFOXYB12_FULL_58_9]
MAFKKDSPLAALGFRSKDVVLTVNARSVSSVAEALAVLKEGTGAVEVKVKRGAKEIALSYTVVNK